MNVIKRNGSVVALDISQVRKQTIPATKGLERTNAEELEEFLEVLLRDNITTTEIQNTLIKSAVNKISPSTPNYTYVAARLESYDLYHRIKRLYNVVSSGDVYKLVPLSLYLSEQTHIHDGFSYKYSADDIEYFNSFIVAERDELFTHPGFVTMRDRYLLKNPDIINEHMKNKDKSKELTSDVLKEATVELPQHMFMRVAMSLMQNERDHKLRRGYVTEAYEYLSNLELIMSTPINSNAARKNGGLISCLLGHVPDSLEGIMDLLKEVAIGSKIGSGWGLDLSKIRSLGSKIQNMHNIAGGKIPFMKIFNDVAIAVDQLGVRPGAIAVTIESWDIDIFDFIETQKKNGDERRRAVDLFIAVSYSDLFMEREASDGTWTLFDPYDVPELTDLYGIEFKEKYEEYEIKFEANPEDFNPNTVVVKARDVFRAHVTTYYNTGNPFVVYKDNVNYAHKHKDLGIIRASNLCQEVLQPTSPEETAVCNLASFNVARYTTKERLEKVIMIGMRCLDNAIDLTLYPSEKSERTQKKRRSTGMGMLGDAEYLANNKMFGSEEHINVITDITKSISEACQKASKEFAKEKGSCIIEGERFSYHMAIAPNSTSGVFAGTTNSGEPVYNVVWKENTNLGTCFFTAPNLNSENLEYYKNAYEIPVEKQIDVVAAKQKYVDMGISFNIYLDPNNLKASRIVEILRYAWQKGLKTAYYFRSQPPKEEEVKISKIACVGCEN
jgi:ribonucleoside-diphosphate reductase alpha chain